MGVVVAVRMGAVGAARGATTLWRTFPAWCARRWSARRPWSSTWRTNTSRSAPDMYVIIIFCFCFGGGGAHALHAPPHRRKVRYSTVWLFRIFMQHQRTNLNKVVPVPGRYYILIFVNKIIEGLQKRRFFFLCCQRTADSGLPYKFRLLLQPINRISGRVRLANLMTLLKQTKNLRLCL